MISFVLAGCSSQKDIEIERPVYAKQQSPNSRASTQSENSPPKAMKVQWRLFFIISNGQYREKNL